MDLHSLEPEGLNTTLRPISDADRLLEPATLVRKTVVNQAAL